MENCIEIKELNKFYGKKKQALSNVNLTIGQGMFGLLGRNGAGKTTLMKTLATLLQKQSGSISVCGIPIENAKAIRKIIGYLPQDFSIYPTMNVIEVMDYLGILSGIGSRERKKRIELLLKKVNLIEQKNKKVKALSGGMKRRLGIAQALLNDPKVLIVDEPISNSTIWGQYSGMNLDYFAPLKYAIGWLMPSAMIAVAIGIFFTELTETPIAIAIQGLWWFIDLNAGVSRMGGVHTLFELTPRHNVLGNTQIFLDEFNTLVANRLVMSGAALLFVIATVIIYEQKRRGRFSGYGKIKIHITSLANRKGKSAA